MSGLNKKRKADEALDAPSAKRRNVSGQDEGTEEVAETTTSTAETVVPSREAVQAKEQTIIELLGISSRKPEEAKSESQRKVRELMKVQKKLETMFGVSMDTEDFGDKLLQEIANVEKKCIKKGMFAGRENNVFSMEQYVTMGVSGLFRYVKDSVAAGCPLLGIAYDLKYFSKGHYDALLHRDDPQKWKLIPSTYNGERYLVRTLFWVTACNTIQRRVNHPDPKLRIPPIADDDWERLRSMLLQIWRKLLMLDPEDKPKEVSKQREYEKCTHYWQTNYKTNKQEKKLAFETTDFGAEIWQTVLIFFKNPTECHMRGVPYNWGFSTTATRNVEIVIDDDVDIFN